jgi:hypothetical protein
MWLTDEMVSIFFAGTAGAGKSTLVGVFQRWMDENGYRAIAVNLDPGAEADMMALQSADIAKAVEEMEADYVLFDVPGQLELFAFRSSSRRIVESLGGPRPLIAYLLDPMLVQNPNGYVTSILLGATVQFRFDIPMVYLLSKVDLMEPEALERVMAWAEDHWRLHSDLYDGEITPSVGFAVDMLEAFKGFGATRTITPVSSASGLGLEDLYSMAQLVYQGGDDLEKR